MWSVDPEERKAEQEKKKREALEKKKLGDTGNPQIVESCSLVSREASWLYYWTESHEMRMRHGVETVKGLWKVFDRALFVRSVSRERKQVLAQLREKWAPKG